MNTLCKSILIFLLIASVVSLGAEAATVDEKTARTVAENWVTTIINHKGSWGNSKTAYVAEVTEFKRGDRVLGYYCQVEPSGHIIISLVEGLAPIKAFSETSYLDPESDEGPADLLKFQLERRLDVIEKELGQVSVVKSDDLDRLLILNHRDSWRKLTAGPIPVVAKTSPDETNHDYVEGTELLTSYWHQGAPYYNLCPAPPPGSPCTNPHCAVGCMALAPSQIMRYWSWHPGRDWPNMPDAMNVSPTAAEIDAVSHLCSDLGVALGMLYCLDDCLSSAYAIDLQHVYEDYSYSATCAYTHRRDWDWDVWYAYIQDNLNQNRPLDYYILHHEIVCDGWWVLTGPMYHMNYGWGGGYNAWYTLDALYQADSTGTPYWEAMTHKIVPKGALGASVAGTITDIPSYPHRYVDRDCSAASAYFMAGQMIHFQPYRTMTCTSGFLRFDGTPEKHTRLYTIDYGLGIRIENGAILMQEGGGIQMRLSRPD